MRFTLLALVAIALALIYSRTHWFAELQKKALDIVAPFYWLTDIPREIGEWGEKRLVSKEQLLQENQSLHTELLVQQHRVQQMAAVVAENTRLRQLLNSADKLENRVLVAELIGVAPNPMLHRVIINRGQDDGVYVGQPVVDASGLVGQVVEIGSTTSWVMLITDTSHALPVQINRNGSRLIAEGRGNLYQLALRHVPNNFDIQVGDLLVSSGLGKRFPSGYPVAVVESVKPNKSSPWAEVLAKPLAELNRNRHVLLVFEEAARVAPTGGLTPPTGEDTPAVASPVANPTTAKPSANSTATAASKMPTPKSEPGKTVVSPAKSAQAAKPATNAAPVKPSATTPSPKVAPPIPAPSPPQ